jgi:hypothetical protein
MFCMGLKLGEHRLKVMLLSWVLGPYSFVGRCKRFGETFCLLLQG